VVRRINRDGDPKNFSNAARIVRGNNSELNGIGRQREDEPQDIYHNENTAHFEYIDIDDGV
jgi:hypothetical protein